MPKIKLSLGWRIVIKKSDDEVAWLAAVELQENLQHIAGGIFPMSTNKPPNTPIFILTHDDAENDGFSWHAEPDCIRLHGNNQRGLLYAVYSFLEALGCRWLAPGDEHTHLPHKKTFMLPDGEASETAALPGRCLVLGHHAFMAHAPDWVVWAARNRLNSIFFHVTESAYALGAAPESQYQKHKEAAVRLARQRGMTIEHGGHLMSSLLPRSVFKTEPGAFRMVKGKRTPDYNFCPTSPEALSTFSKKAAEHFQKHPEVDIFHLWADDLPGGGWCECEHCRVYTPAEQLLLATNTIADVLKAIKPSARISLLAYHDTEEINALVKPRSNVFLLWAPRKRCYAHAVDDKDCPINSPAYNHRFIEQVRFMQSNGAAPPGVFEYYMDGILFKSALPPLMMVMQEDLRFYHKSGVHTVRALMTGDRPWHTTELNPWLFTRLSWNPDQDVKALVSSFSRALLGKDMWGYYHAIEEAYKLALDLAGEQSELNFGKKVSTVVVLRNPPTDIGDPANAPEKILRKKAKKNAKMLNLLKVADKNLVKVKAEKQARPLRLEREAFELYRAWLTFDLRRVQLYNAVGSKNIGRESRTLLKETRSALHQVQRWGKLHINDRRYLRNFRFMRLVFWELRLNKIQAQYFSLPPGRIWLGLKSLILVMAARARMRDIYR